MKSYYDRKVNFSEFVVGDAVWFHSACTNCQNQEVPGLPSPNIWRSWLSNFFTHFQKFNLNILKLSFME